MRCFLILRDGGIRRGIDIWPHFIDGRWMLDRRSGDAGVCTLLYVYVGGVWQPCRPMVRIREKAQGTMISSQLYGTCSLTIGVGDV
ncbi:hypothetical protein BGX38DRAFT_490593 [Terfezia claveryi]|nr:hypothetical protein BGX38DRAFT_490593 [Terfezia claveryi]